MVAQGHHITVARLLANGADPYAALSDGTTVAHLAAKLNHHRIIVLLIEAKAHIDARDGQGNTPLCVAAENEAADTIETLLHLKANPGIYNNQGETPLIIAMKRARGFKAQGLDESESIELSRALRASRALRTKHEPWGILEAELNKSLETLRKDVEFNAFYEAAMEKTHEKDPAGLYNDVHINQAVSGHKESKRGAPPVNPTQTSQMKVKLVALIRRGFGAVNAPILGPDGFPALNDRMQLRSQLFEDPVIAQVICERILTPLMELLSEQELSDDVQGCRLRSFARYILKCGVVQKMRQSVARAVISAETRINGVLSMAIAHATECLENLTPEVRGLVNCGQAWVEVHQTRAW